MEILKRVQGSVFRTVHSKSARWIVTVHFVVDHVSVVRQDHLEHSLVALYLVHPLALAFGHRLDPFCSHHSVDKFNCVDFIRVKKVQNTYECR